MRIGSAGNNSEAVQKIREAMFRQYDEGIRIPLFGRLNPAWGGGTEVICPVCGKSFWLKPYQIKRRKDPHCSHGCFGIDLSYKTGPDSPNWKGGVKSENQRIRATKEYSDWRNLVFARDGWVCRYCGGGGGHLEAHHILSFAEYPEFRFSLVNGITLCEECHDGVRIREV
jgi:hypothetical protein